MSKGLADVIRAASVKHGLERETIRTDARGRIAMTPHPRALGSPLTHPYITMDFSEAQLELITPPTAREQNTLGFLEKMQAWSYRKIGAELLWPFSMPPILPKHKRIPLADFGASAEGHKRNIYREGLKRRYGGAVQTISGIHYNFSLADSFWIIYAKKNKSTKPLADFKDEAYFGLMRNVIRFVPLTTYLFGASPVADTSFFRAPLSGLKKLDTTTYYGPFATSLRLSNAGYQNKKAVPVSVSYNSLAEYVSDLFRAVTTPSKLWSALGIFKNNRRVQLNANILQLENELYSSVRPKQKKSCHPNQSLVASLSYAGVEYVELRSIDINPYEPTGISIEQLRFLRAFMMYCLLTPSPRFKDGEQQQYENNNTAVALYGRKPGLKIIQNSTRVNFTEWSLKTLAEIEKVARMIDAGNGTDEFAHAVQAEREKILDPAHTPSARVLRGVMESGLSYAEYGIALAKKHKRRQLSMPLTTAYAEKMRTYAAASLADISAAEARDAWVLSDFEHLELSTQVVIRAAQKRNIDVEVLNDKENVIELRQGSKKEIVKQATITSRDSYISYELMKDKELTKQSLARAGIATPHGGRFEDASEALKFCMSNRSKALVVKPVSTNFGTGVSVLKPRQDKAYATAVRRALRHGSIIVEEFIPGKEYRFLVINCRVVAVLNREPANVVGDGSRTVRELVRMKNTDPKSLKLPDSYIKLGIVEREVLAEERLSLDFVPARGRKVYLRKNSNVHNGGDPIDVPDMPQAYKTIALKAAASVGANICGVDMIIRNPKKKPAADAYSIIELNFNPALYLHAYPFKGERRDVGGAVLDFLGF